MPDPKDELTRILRREIAAAGPISFARFMETALYDPVHGYYQQPLKQIGCQGDFYTSVSVGALFGKLLGLKFAEWLDSLNAADANRNAPEITGSRFQVVETGAHDGRLAADILSWFQIQRADLAAQLDYWIVEPFAPRRNSQKAMLEPFQQRVRWFGDWSELIGQDIRGIIFSNELLDALPVFVLGWDAANQRWFEWKVDLEKTSFRWVRSGARSTEVEMELTSEFWRSLSPDLARALPDGFTVEICPAAHAWWSRAAKTLREGKLLTFDYGLEWDEVFAAHRSRGTLRSYRSHRATLDPLALPGEQDLTAHVNFSAIIQAGESAGLKTDCFCPQSVFLTRIASQAFSDLRRFGSWDHAQTRQFQTLTHPEHLGRAFRALVQTRGGPSFDR